MKRVFSFIVSHTSLCFYCITEYGNFLTNTLSKLMVILLILMEDTAKDNVLLRTEEEIILVDSSMSIFPKATIFKLFMGIRLRILKGNLQIK